MATPQHVIGCLRSWPKAFQSSGAKHPKTPGQKQRSARKDELREQRHAADIAEASRLGITVAELQQRKYDAVKHLFRDSAESKTKAALAPRAFINTWHEARCPNCDAINENCVTGLNKCRRCAAQFNGHH